MALMSGRDPNTVVTVLNAVMIAYPKFVEDTQKDQRSTRLVGLEKLVTERVMNCRRR
jgi:hypothetical protein